jgi:hypothetical protein
MVPDTETQEQIRLLRCDDCLTLEELPDFDGPAEYDTLLIVLTDKHKFPNGEPHRGRLIKVEKRAWGMSNLKEAILQQIWQGSKGLAEFDSTHYEVKQTFHEDALKCYAQHLRPQEGCPDFNSPSKILKPDTKAERKEIGLSPQGMPVIHLCSFCPVRSYMERKARGD